MHIEALFLLLLLHFPSCHCGGHDHTRRGPVFPPLFTFSKLPLRGSWLYTPRPCSSSSFNILQAAIVGVMITHTEALFFLLLLHSPSCHCGGHDHTRRGPVLPPPFIFSKLSLWGVILLETQFPFLWPPRWPLWGAYYLRHWLAHKVLAISGRGVWASHPALLAFYYRWMLQNHAMGEWLVSAQVSGLSSLKKEQVWERR